MGNGEEVGVFFVLWVGRSVEGSIGWLVDLAGGSSSRLVRSTIGRLVSRLVCLSVGRLR